MPIGNTTCVTDESIFSLELAARAWAIVFQGVYTQFTITEIDSQKRSVMKGTEKN